MERHERPIGGNERQQRAYRQDLHARFATMGDDEAISLDGGARTPKPRGLKLRSRRQQQRHTVRRAPRGARGLKQDYPLSYAKISCGH